jgi:hypothetical protein
MVLWPETFTHDAAAVYGHWDDDPAKVRTDTYSSSSPQSIVS